MLLGLLRAPCSAHSEPTGGNRVDVDRKEVPAF